MLCVLRIRAAGFPSPIYWVDQDTVCCVALSTYKRNETRTATRWFDARYHFHFMPAPSADNLVRQTHVQLPACFPRNGETLESANPFLAELGQLPPRIRTEELPYF
jgi:hypothetical protein